MDINKSIKDYKNWYTKVQADEDGQLPFVWELMRTSYTDFHYGLIISKNTNEKFRQRLWSRFDEHGEDAALLLLSKLDKNEDTDFHADIIFYLGKIADRQNKYKGEVQNHARKLADSSDKLIREKAIIVLGWIGALIDLPLLAEHLLNDSYNKCKAWSATSFIQMWFRNKSTELVNIVLPYLRQSIQKEKGLFVLGCCI